MSWLEDLDRQLGARGVTGRRRRRIVLELRDHIECDPGCEERLGAPRELAATFADELAAHSARRCAWYVFGALATAAVALVASLAAVGPAGGYPRYGGDLSPALSVPVVLGTLVAPQVALVAGMLAAVRAARRRRARVLPAAEIALIRRRARVAATAGFATVAGLALYLVNFSSVLPVSRVAAAAGLAALAGAALFAASAALARSGMLRSSMSGEAGDVYDDAPAALRLGWLRRYPWLLGVAGSLGAAFALTLLEARAEHSLVEGLERGVFEGLAAAAGFVLLGRALGLTPARADTTEPLASSMFAVGRPRPDQLVADAERSRAEMILRDGYAEGRLSLQELITRLGAVHDARTAEELDTALAGLPHR